MLETATKPLVLALDLATTTGWAMGQIGHRCDHGSIRFGQRSKLARAEIFYNCKQWLNTSFETKPDIIVYEQPIPMGFGRTNFESIRILNGIPAIVELWSYENKIFRISDVNVKSIRKYILGTIPDGKIVKAEIIKKIISYGYIPTDHNAADAIALWIYATKTFLSEVA